MNFSLPLKWFQTAVGSKLTVEDIQRDVALLGFDVQIQPSVYTEENVVIARVISTEQHPQADRLKVCQVDDGSGAFVQIVCGCPTVRPGMLVPMARVGAVLPKATMKVSDIRGITSSGMLCSHEDLGIASSATGLWSLAEDYQVGACFFDALDYSAPVIVFEVTANRRDCLSLEGIVREWRALVEHRATPVELQSIPTAYAPFIAPYKYSMPKGIMRAYWIRLSITQPIVLPEVYEQRLRALGKYSQYPLLNIQRLAEIQWGLPMHVYGAMPGDEWRIEQAGEGTSFLGLDGVEYALSTQDYVIRNGDEIVALPGILGGMTGRYQGETDCVWIEALAIDPRIVHDSARRLSIRTDAALRHGRGIVPGLVTHAVSGLLSELAHIDGIVVESIIHYDVPQHQQKVTLDLQDVANTLGYDPKDQVFTALEALGFTCVDKSQRMVEFSVPWYRGDIEGPRDLVEEVIRYLGYDTLSECHDVLDSSIMPHHDNTRDIIDGMLVSYGFDETIHYSFIDPSWDDQRDKTQGESIRLLNPISTELSLMRTTLLPGLIKTAHYRYDHQADTALLYEWGRTFIVQDGVIVENEVLGLLMSGARHPVSPCEKKRACDFYDLRAIVELITQRIKGPLTVRYMAHNVPMLHPKTTATLWCDTSYIGWISMVHPAVTEGYPHAFYAEINMLAMQDSHSAIVFQPFYKNPVVYRDLTLECPHHLTYESLDAFLRDACIPELKNWQLIDIYYPQGASHMRSISLRLCLSDGNKSLRDSDVDKILSYLRNILSQHLSVELKSNEDTNES